MEIGLGVLDRRAADEKAKSNYDITISSHMSFHSRNSVGKHEAKGSNRKKEDARLTRTVMSDYTGSNLPVLQLEAVPGPENQSLLLLVLRRGRDEGV